MKNLLIEHNPMLKKPAVIVLSLLKSNQNCSREVLEEEALKQWSDSYFPTPSVMIETLVDAQVITEQLFISGTLYKGTLEDVQMDSSIPDDASFEQRVVLTAEGIELLNAYVPQTMLQELMQSKPHYAELFKAMLTACLSEQGCSRADLETILNSFEITKINQETQQAKVYPQYFIDALESAGGIEWSNSWRTTEAGCAVLKNCAA